MTIQETRRLKAASAIAIELEERGCPKRWAGEIANSYVVQRDEAQDAFECASAVVRQRWRNPGAGLESSEHPSLVGWTSEVRATLLLMIAGRMYWR